MVVLEFVRGSQAGMKVELDKARITMGRDPESDVVLTDQRTSWNHCVIEWTENGYVLIDLGSSNGTYIGDELRPVTVPERLTYGESIWFGDTEVLFRTNLEVKGHEIAAEGKKPPVGATMTLDARSALAMMEQVHQLKAQKMRKKNVDGRNLNTNPAELWEGVTDESVVVDEVLREEDLASFPDSFRLRAKLIFLAGPHAGREIFLGSKPTTFGRAEDNVCPLEDDVCSRYHTEVTRDEKGIYYVSDLGSRNGTALNGKDIRDKTPLQHRSLMTLGQSIIEFHAQNIDERTENPLSTVAMSLPLYAFQGKVLTQYEITLGLDPTSDLFLDDRSVDRHHATIQWRGDHFQIRDSSNRGTKVNDKRIIQHDLVHGDKINIGVFTLAIGIEGLRANIEIERLAFQDAAESFVSAPSDRGSYKTMFRIDVPAVLKERVPTASEQAPEGVDMSKMGVRRLTTWVAPMETQASWRLPLLLMGGIFTIVSFVALFAVTGGTAFMNEPLSEIHNSPAFTAVADSTESVSANCTACHSVFKGLSQDNCKGCHTDVTHRASHLAAVDKGEKRFDPNCTSCHKEHQSKEALLAFTNTRCIDCHTSNPHGDLASKPPPSPKGLEKMRAKAQSIPVRTLSRDELHAKHAGLDRRCVGCHSKADMSGPLDNPGSACFRCHDAGTISDLKGATDCVSCHGGEHSGSEPLKLVKALGEDKIKAAAAPFGDTSGFTLKSIAKGFGLALLLFFPLGLILMGHGVFTSFVARRHREEDFVPPPNPDNYYVIIDPEICVAISACAYACPYNVIELEGSPKQAVTKRIGACHGCRACEKVCTPNAIIVVKAGEGLPSKDFPDLDPYYQAPDVPGLFLIGQVTEFKGLMKNASNMAVRVLEYVNMQGLKPGDAKKKGFDVEIFIAGAGPGGVSAAVKAKQMGYSAVLCEKTTAVANTHRNSMPKGKHLQPNPPLLAGIGPAVPSKYDTPERPKEDVINDFERVLKQAGVEVVFRQEIKDVKPDGEGFIVTTTSGTYRALKVILSIGNNGNPRKAGCLGEDLDKVLYSLVDPDVYNGKKILVLGGGNSAVEAAFAMADANGGTNEVTLSYRGGVEKMSISGMNKEKLLKLGGTHAGVQKWKNKLEEAQAQETFPVDAQ